MKAASNTKKLLKMTGELRKKDVEALTQYRGMRYRDIPKDGQEYLVMMVDEAILLSEIMGKDEIK